MYSGKSVLLEAIAFACGAPASNLRVNHLAEVNSQGQADAEVEVQWSSAADEQVCVKTSLSKHGRCVRGASRVLMSIGLFRVCVLPVRAIG
jgi:recombinational DNA repair ATPase RecF